jgi:hypothetical protein
MTIEDRGTQCMDKQETTPTLTQHHIKAVVRKERERVEIKIKGTEDQKNLATIAASPATQLVTVDEDKERRRKSKTTMRRRQGK